MKWILIYAFCFVCSVVNLFSTPDRFGWCTAWGAHVLLNGTVLYLAIMKRRLKIETVRIDL